MSKRLFESFLLVVVGDQIVVAPDYIYVLSPCKLDGNSHENVGVVLAVLFFSSLGLHLFSIGFLKKKKKNKNRLYPGTASVCLNSLTIASNSQHFYIVLLDINSFFQKLLTRLTRVHKPYAGLPYFRPKRLENHTIWGCTYLYNY